jgi:hypothetical protein
LLRSDVPLDDDARRQIADAWEREHRTKEQASLDAARLFLYFIDMDKRRLNRRGLTMVDAEKQIAAQHGWKVGTLHKELQRARKRLREAGQLEGTVFRVSCPDF